MSYPYSSQPDRYSTYSPQQNNAPPPPPRPQSAYDPYPSSRSHQTPIPPPRPSSPYIAPFPGTNYNDGPPQLPPVSYTEQWEPQAQQQQYGTPLYQPRPLPALNEPHCQLQAPIAPPPRTTSLYDPNFGAGYNNATRPSPGNANAGYAGTDHSSPERAFSPPLLSPQAAAQPTGAFAPTANTFPGPPPSAPSGQMSFANNGAVASIASTLQALTLDTRPSSTPPNMTGAHQNFPTSSSSSMSFSSTATEQPRIYALPTVESLQAASSTLDNAEDGDQIAWAQDVLRLIDRHLNPAGGPTDFTHPDTPPPTTLQLTSALRDLLEMAVPIIIVVSTSPSTRAASLACYLKARLQSSGLCQEMLPKNQRQAFKDFEAAARGGEVRGWFRLGRDYEGVNDLQRAKDCFDRGVKRGDCECIYRMGMAHLLGQLNLTPNPAQALALLRQASDMSTIDSPQPSYVYGMLLAGELSVPTEIPSHLVLPPTSPTDEALYAQWSTARDAIERAAYLCYSPAQYKAGQLYEHAALGCAYDPIVSVNWYKYASENGETEADMALSRWFLCGAEGSVPKNENLAKSFADKAAKKGHPNGCFALGYYYELGVGGRKDLDQARKWYQKAANLGNADAPARLAALSAPVPSSISMAEHESRLNDTLVRRRTQAKIRSHRASISRPTRRPVQQPISMASSNPGFTSPRPDRGSSLPTPTAPAPRVGEVMSPNSDLGYSGQGFIPTANGFPARPPIPQQASHASNGKGAPGGPGGPGSRPSTSPEAQNFPRRQAGAGQNGSEVGSGNGRRYTATSTASLASSSSLSDLPVPERRPGNEDGQRPKKEAQTFAEMGFVSKPVEEDGCVVM